MRLFPLTRRVALFGRRDINGVMYPAVPFRRYLARFGIAVIDDPAPIEAERRVDLAALGAVVGIALPVLADQFAEPPGPQLRAKGLAAPPCEKFQQKQLHEDSAGWRGRAALMPSADQIVQTCAGIPALAGPALAVSGPALAVSRPALAVSGPAPGGVFGGSSVSGALSRNRAQ